MPNMFTISKNMPPSKSITTPMLRRIPTCTPNPKSASRNRTPPRRRISRHTTIPRRSILRATIAVVRATTAAARTLAVAIKAEIAVAIVAETAAAAVSDVAVDAVAAAADARQAPEARPAVAICRRRSMPRRKASQQRPDRFTWRLRSTRTAASRIRTARISNLAALTIAAPKPAPVLLDPPNPAPKTKSFSPASRSRNIATSRSRSRSHRAGRRTRIP